MDLQRLSRTACHALRHDPAAYGLALDAEGWVSVTALAQGLRVQCPEIAEVGVEQIENLACQEPSRYEFQEGRIRARYGHGLDQAVAHVPAMPPEVLFHGTDWRSAAVIASEGLKPMGRRYVHLTSDLDYARSLKLGSAVVLVVKAAEAQLAGVEFYQATETVWLAHPVAAIYISQLDLETESGDALQALIDEDSRGGWL